MDIKTVKNNDYVVIHFQGNYKPSVTIIESSKFNDYFSEGNGFEITDIKKLKTLEGGQTYSSLDDILVIKM